MQMLAVDADNDLYLDPTGSLARSSQLAATMQACAHAAKAQMGEMIYAADQGIPNFDVVWNGSPNLLQFEAAMRATLLAVPHVLEVKVFTAAIQGGKVVYSATIHTEYGEGVLNG